ncbi:FMRFamide receptor-like [Physella acuta]|uniref:FMRFamide receptor-like n=1 Tax=Physella acuta TaxID=109671 RepID=UPI0027DCD115|nr:FMRFamide receptor-like [Physella acuta]
MESGDNSTSRVPAQVTPQQFKPSNLLDDNTRHMFELVVYVFLSSILGVLGVFGNVVNIIIFYRQGLNNTVNISFTGLAISDLSSLVTLLWFDVCVNPLFAYSGIPMVTSEVQHLSGGWPRACFARITTWITVYITAERCLCIASPLKVKKIITPKRTTVILCSIYIFTILPLIPEYSTAYLSWQWDDNFNTTVLRLGFTPNRHEMEGLTSLVYFIYVLLSYFSVVLLTGILVYKLKQKTKWRQESTFDNLQSEKLSNRDRKTISMVIVIASVLIACCALPVGLYIVGFVIQGFGVIGEYSNFFFVTWSFAFLTEAFNATINTVLYYKMSSKYKEKFNELFSCCFNLRMSGNVDKIDEYRDSKYR